jgi:tetraacyldisaccharide 4'-kinase
LREPVTAAATRCQAAVLIGEDMTGATSRLPSNLPVLTAELVQDPSIAALAGRKIVAFAGIALPDKFFDPLRRAGAILAATRPFPDHHAYTASELDILLRDARDHQATLVTTPKDAVRLSPAVRTQVTVIGVGLEWHHPEQIERMLEKMIAAGPSSMR